MNIERRLATLEKQMRELFAAQARERLPSVIFVAPGGPYPDLSEYDIDGGERLFVKIIEIDPAEPGLRR